REPPGGLGLQPVDYALGDLASRGAEEVDRANLGQTAAQARNTALELGSRRPIEGGPTRASPEQLLGFGRDRRIVRLPGRSKRRLDLAVGEAGNEGRLADRRLATARLDLAQNPLKVLCRLVGSGKHIHRVLDGDRTDSLQTAPDLYAQVVRFGRKLMNE